MNQLVESIDSEGEEKYYYYDTWGNLISDGIAQYHYDYLNRLKEYRPFGVVDGTHYTYYIDNLRKSKDDTYFIWLDGNMVYEFSGSDSSTYTYGHRLIYSDNVKYVLNAHGDVVALLNGSGENVKEYDYDAFGNELNIDTTDTNPFRYCAEYFDTETGTIYLRARYYSPVTGRFTQLDPIRDGLNWYAYCYNNPVLFVDFWGLIPYEYFETRDAAAADFGQYIGEESIDNEEEYASAIYKVEKNGKTYYYYDEPRNDFTDKKDREISFRIEWKNAPSRTVCAIIHTHGAYDADTGNTKDFFSTPENVISSQVGISDTENSDRIGLDYYLVSPNGYLKLYETRSANYQGITIRDDMPIDPRIKIHNALIKIENFTKLKVMPGLSRQKVVNRIKSFMDYIKGGLS